MSARGGGLDAVETMALPHAEGVEAWLGLAGLQRCKHDVVWTVSYSKRHLLTVVGSWQASSSELSCIGSSSTESRTFNAKPDCWDSFGTGTRTFKLGSPTLTCGAM